MTTESKPKRCTISSHDTVLSPYKRCKGKYFGSLKVQVFHSNSGRKTWQTWHLCQDHWHDFLNEKGEGYYAWYKKNPHKKAFVTDFKVIGAL